MKNTIYAASIGFLLLGASAHTMEHVFAANAVNAFSLFLAQRIEREDQEGGVREDASPRNHESIPDTIRTNMHAVSAQTQRYITQLKKWYVRKLDRSECSLIYTDGDDDPTDMIPLEPM